METNPYESTNNVTQEGGAYCQITVSPIIYLKRSYALIEGQYLLFLAIVFCGVFLGSLAPMGLLLGPMIVGINLCFIDLESERKVEFSTLFNGMSQFLDCFLVTLAVLLVNFVFAFCVVCLAFAGIALVALTVGPQESNSALPAVLMIGGFVIFYLVVLVASVAVYLPFMFSFQLIADRKLPAKMAIITSARAVYSNLWPLVGLMTCLMFISMLAALCCYIPAILLAPINFGVFFLIYRDLFPKPDAPLDPEAALQPAS